MSYPTARTAILSIRNPTDFALRKFILKLSLFLTVFGFVLCRRHLQFYPVWIGFWFCYLMVSWIKPANVRPMQRLAHVLSRALSKVISFLALTLVYFLVLVPVGLTARLFGKFFLTLGADPKLSSYWIKRETTPMKKSDWERQF